MRLDSRDVAPCVKQNTMCAGACLDRQNNGYVSVSVFMPKIRYVLLSSCLAYLIYLILSYPDKIRDKIVGFHKRHDSHATRFRDAGPLTPRHKGTVCGDDVYLILSRLCNSVP